MRELCGWKLRSALLNNLAMTHYGHSLSGEPAHAVVGDELQEINVHILFELKPEFLSPCRYLEHMKLRQLNLNLPSALFAWAEQGWAGMAEPSRKACWTPSMGREVLMIAERLYEIAGINRVQPARTALRTTARWRRWRRRPSSS